MISIAIVEDEELYAKQLQQFLHQYEKENKEMFDITVYSDGDQIVNKYKSQYDIILMDVEMKFMDGMCIRPLSAAIRAAFSGQTGPY